MPTPLSSIHVPDLERRERVDDENMPLFGRERWKQVTGLMTSVKLIGGKQVSLECHGGKRTGIDFGVVLKITNLGSLIITKTPFRAGQAFKQKLFIFEGSTITTFSPLQQLDQGKNCTNFFPFPSQILPI
jgi:hypothetical protein